MGDFEQISGPNDAKEWRYDIVGLIDPRGHVWGWCTIVGLWVLGQGMGEIYAEVFAHY